MDELHKMDRRHLLTLRKWIESLQAGNEWSPYRQEINGVLTDRKWMESLQAGSEWSHYRQEMNGVLADRKRIESLQTENKYHYGVQKRLRELVTTVSHFITIHCTDRI